MRSAVLLVAGATLFGCRAPTPDQADLYLFGDVPWGRFGTALAVGDLDGDGVDDLVVGAPTHSAGTTAPGEVLVFRGPLDAASTASLVVQGDFEFGASVALPGDVDGDGVADLIVGSSFGVHVVSGDAQGVLETSPDDAFGEGSRPWAIGDVDGDGNADLGIAASRRNGGSVGDPGWLRVYLGPVDFAVDAPAAEIEGHRAFSGIGHALLAPGDVDGDGAADLVVGAPGTEGGDAAGRVYVVSGPFDQDITLDDSVPHLSGSPGEDFGASLALLSSEPGVLALAVSASRVEEVRRFDDVLGAPQDDEVLYAHRGRLDGLDTTLLAVVEEGEEAVYVGAPATSFGATGRYAVVRGDAFAGAVDRVETDGGGVSRVLRGDQEGQWTGGALASGDLNDDGAVDLVVGVPGDGDDWEGGVAILWR